MIPLLALSAALLSAPPVGQATIAVFNPSEAAVRVEERWSLRLTDPVAPGGLVLPVPASAENPQTEPDSARFELRGGELVNKQPLEPGIVELVLRYRRATAGGRLEFTRESPFSLMAARLLVSELPGLRVETVPAAQGQLQRFGDERYRVFNLPQQEAGARLLLQIEGLPMARHWPQALAVLAALSVWLWFAWQLKRPAAPRPPQQALSLSARKARLLTALRQLDASRDPARERRYQRRRRELITALAALLKAEDRAPAGSATAGQATADQAGHPDDPTRQEAGQELAGAATRDPAGSATGAPADAAPPSQAGGHPGGR